MINIKDSAFFIFCGLYLVVISYLNLAKGKKILSIIEIIDVYLTRLKHGKKASDNRKSDLLSPWKHKLFNQSFLILGICTLIVGLGIALNAK